MSSKKEVTLSEAIAIINRGPGFNLQAVTCSLERKEGGRRIKLKHCSRVGSNHSERDNGTITVKEAHKRDYPVTIHTCLIESINGMTVL